MLFWKCAKAILCHVSILILLDVVLEVTNLGSEIDAIFVSILILLDVVLEDQLNTATNIGRPVFQSLFCWMLFWKKKRRHLIGNRLTCFNPYSVGCCSGSARRILHRLIFYRFNPYSVGCCSGREWVRSRLVSTIYVSILILLDVVLEGFDGHGAGCVVFGFNPYSVGCCSGSVFLPK